MMVQDKFKHLKSPRLNERRVVNFAASGISDVVNLGRYEYHSVKPGLSSHSHPGAIEICYLVRGRQSYRLEGRDYQLVGGEVFVVPPGAPHDTAGDLEDCGVMFWLILRIPRPRTSMLNLCPKDSAVIRHQLLNIPRRHFVGRPVLKPMFDRLFELHDAPADPLNTLLIRHVLLDCILEIIHCANNSHWRRSTPHIEKVLRRIEAFPEEEYSLSGLANEAGLSLSRFKVKFKSETGIAPREFILRAKVDKAKRNLLEKETTVTDIAMQLGFSSSQYFATVFKRFTKQTPMQFRESPSMPVADAVRLN
jgi:AraC-like DNA-binding protein